MDGHGLNNTVQCESMEKKTKVTGFTKTDQIITKTEIHIKA